VSDLFAVLCLAAAFIAATAQPGGLPSVPVSLFGLAGVASMMAGQWQLHRVRTDEQAHRAIEPIVHGYILLLSSMVLIGRPGWVTLLVAYYALFVLMIRARPAQDQI
jgi:hypothetical protein